MKSILSSYNVLGTILGLVATSLNKRKIPALKGLTVHSWREIDNIQVKNMYVLNTISGSDIWRKCRVRGWIVVRCYFVHDGHKSYLWGGEMWAGTKWSDGVVMWSVYSRGLQGGSEWKAAVRQEQFWHFWAIARRPLCLQLNDQGG